MKSFSGVLLLFGLAAGLACVGVVPAEPNSNEDWPMLGGRAERNPVAEGAVALKEWDVLSGKNVKWSAQLGSQTYASPVVAGGVVLIGTNNDNPRDPSVTGDKGVLMAFDAADGSLLWQAVSDKLPQGGVHDWPMVGVCSTPLVEEERVYFVNNRDELVALDLRGFRDGENDGPYRDEPSQQPTDADILWKLDMMAELGVFPHNASNTSPAAYGKLLFVGTSNGRSEDHSTVPSPQAPSLVAVDKETGKVMWSDNSPGENILNGQWTAPTVATIGGVPQVVIGQGDGWVRGFEATSGKKLWEFDTNPKDSIYPSTRNEILGTAVAAGDYIYIANGQDPENGEGEGHLYCIDATKRGDITETGRVWHFDGIRRSISTPVVYDGLLWIPDFSGFFHCLDAKTGEKLWEYDTFAAVWGSPVVVGGVVYLGDEDGDVILLEASRTKKELGEYNMEGAVYSTPAPAGGVLYIANRDQLYALQEAP